MDAAAEALPPQEKRYLSVGLIMLSQSFQSLTYGGIGLFLPLIRKDIGLSFTQAGTLSAASTLTYALMQIPSGYVADRIGPRRLFVVGLIGANVLAFVFALLDDFWLFFVNQAVTGVLRALVFAPGLLLIMALFPPQRRATAMGLFVAGGFSSSVLLNLFGPLLVGPVGWRHLFMIFAAGGVVVCLAYWRFGAPAPVRTTAPVPLRQALDLFRYPQMWLIGGIQYVRLAVFIGISFWLPSFLVDERHRSLQLAGVIVAIAAAITAPSNFLGGYISDRLRSPYLVIGGSLAAIAITTFLMARVHDIVLLIVVISINAIFVQLYFGPLFSVPVEMLGPRAAGMASGFGNFFANMGGFTFAFTLGRVKDVTGSFDIGFYTLSAAAVLGLACTITLSRMKPLAQI